MHGFYATSIFLEKILNFDGFYWLFYSTSLLLTTLLLYKKCRPYFKVRVNCWFCNCNSWVPFENFECFDCPQCDQYNGFSPDGNYNTDILHRGKGRSSDVRARTPVKQAENGLCEKCNTNQRLKIHQLANFTPINEKNYDQELRAYRDQLEKSYALCDRCNLVLTQTLQTQQYQLLTTRLNRRCRAVPPTKPALKEIWRQRGTQVSHVSVVVCGAFLVATSLFNILSALPTLFWLDPILKDLHIDLLIAPLLEYRLLIIILGCIFLGGKMTLLRQRPRKLDALKVFSWISRLAVSWVSSDPVVISSVDAIGVVIDFWEGRDTQQVGFVTAHAANVKPVVVPAVAKIAPVSKASNNVTPSPKKVVESNEKENNVPKNETRIIETRSQTAKKNEKLVKEPNGKLLKQANENRGRLSSPPPEFYDGFSSLRLSSPPREVVSPVSQTTLRNTSEPFKEKGKSLIKPSKLNFDASNRSTRSPFAPQEGLLKSSLNQVSSRNSAVVEKIDDSQYAPLSVSPIPHGKDFYCGYGNSPSPCFSGPMGQTTIYTYARPGTYPYPFPTHPFPTPYPTLYESPGFPSNYSQNSNSSVISESSGGRGFDGWLKYGLYATSVLFNMITMVMMAIYFFRNW